MPSDDIPQMEASKPDLSSMGTIHEKPSALSLSDDNGERNTDDIEKTGEANALTLKTSAVQSKAIDFSNLPSDHPMHPSQFPEGGRAWLVVLGAFFAIFSSFGWVNCIGVFQDYYQLHQLRDYSPSDISWISSLEAFILFIGGPFVGKIFDNYGPRYLLLFGTFLHVFGIMMTSISKSYYQILLAQAICSPLGASCLFYTGLNCVNTWFMRRRGLALGVVATGSSLGGVLLPIAVTHLFPKVGFGWTLRIVGFILLVVLIISNLTLRSRLAPRPVPFAPMEFVRPFQEPVFTFNMIASFCVFVPLLIPINFIIVQADTVGMSQHLQNYIIPLLNAASIFGRVLPGYLADKVGRFNMQIFMSAFTGVSCLALWIPAKGNALVIVFAIFYGFGSGAFVSLAPTIIGQITEDLSKIGVRTGSMFFVVSFAALVGSPIGGALVSAWNGGFLGLQLFCGILQISGAVMFLLTKGYASGWDWFAKL